MDQKWMHNINEIYQVTDEVFLEEMQDEVFNNFKSNYSYLKDKNILWWDESTYNIKFLNIKNNLLNSNNHFYISNGDKLTKVTTQEKKSLKKNNLIFDVLIVPCFLFDYQNNFIPPKSLIKNIKNLKYKELVVLSLTIQASNNINDTNQLKGNIVTNNFFLKLKK